MRSVLFLTCDDSAAGYLKARYRTHAPRPEIVPLLARLIRAPITGLGVRFGPINGLSRDENGKSQGDRHLLHPDVDLGIADLLLRWGDAERVEFYVDPDPNSQLLMTLLLTQALSAGVDHRKIFLMHGPVPWGQVDALKPPTEMASPRQVEESHLELAASVWTAYCAPTPESWFTLLRQNVDLFPFLQAAMDALLDDLPRPESGLGACEHLALTTIGASGSTVGEVVGAFYQDPVRRLIDLSQIVPLLGSLADGATPLIEGLQGRLRAEDYHEDADAWDAFRGSHLRLTHVGSRILAGELDFIEAHGIDRWWGGTRLEASICWRWDRETRTLAHPIRG
ncbi:hypothetical protein [Pararhizobium qamdonense]|uniref:hypothetical protein n=1 Tax=Pararhizobium qamdonense TaxID=3031126 RepID=UPI0023E097E1|nr:hypothetical protein [Pararhizobium qamdonense]